MSIVECSLANSVPDGDLETTRSLSTLSYQQANHTLSFFPAKPLALLIFLPANVCIYTYSSTTWRPLYV